MPTYKVQARERVRTMGIFDADSREEAKEMFRQEWLKVDYSKVGLLVTTSGWNPRAYLYTEEEE